jgi:imidazoleglycerol phosphate dehydratase HisB
MNAVPEVLPRTACRRRHTREIFLEAAIDLDRSEPVVVSTDIGFLNHQIAQLAREAGFALWLSCEAGPRADARLVLEDCAIELGAALALATDAGARRPGSEVATAVQDARAAVRIDLAGPAGARIEGDFGMQTVGGLPLDLVPVFFHSLGCALGAGIWIRVSGPVPTHRVAASFRGFGIAIREMIG